MHASCLLECIDVEAARETSRASLFHLSLNAKTNPSPTFGMWQACKGIRCESENNLEDEPSKVKVLFSEFKTANQCDIVEM